MTTLGIFTVKKVCCHEGHYYTYGGFGDYLAAMRKRFDRVLLVAHVKLMAPPEGHYPIQASEDLDIVHLPQTRSELGVVLTLPIMFWRSWRAVLRMDVAHVRMPDYTGVIGALVCRMRGKPMFCQIVADWYVEAQCMPITRKYGLGVALKLHLYLYDFMERLVSRGQMVFAQGQTCYDKHKTQSDCELVLSTAHHVEDIVTPVPRFQRRPYTILTVARLTGVKNLELIVQALARLTEASEDWRVVFVGEGPRRTALEALANKVGLAERVRLPGQVQRGMALWRHFDEADCFVLSSRSEGTPKVLLEAMARGLPIVASAVAGVPTIVAHEERGLLFRDDDVDALLAALRRISIESDLRGRMVANAHQYCAAHTVERVTVRMLDKVFRRWPSLSSRSMRR